LPLEFSLRTERYDGGSCEMRIVMRVQSQTSRTVAREVPAAVMPRPVAFIRRLFVLGGVLGAVYVGLALIELDHIAASRAANGIRDLIVYTMGLAVVVAVTMLPFALLVRRARPWWRTAMIATCVALIMLSMALVSVDAAALPTGDVLRLSSPVVTAWFPWLHYVAAGSILVAGIGGVVGLAGADAGEYFRRHQRISADDPRLWSVSQLRNLQWTRSESAAISSSRPRSASLAVSLDSGSTSATVSRLPAPAVTARAA
jgi:hypothetical protein